MENNITTNIIPSNVKPIEISKEMKTSFLNYAMSVIVSRALPDVRDGLKPVHRRILFGMYELGVFSDKPFKKSARIVGDVMGKYHPHGDSSIYEAMVRMAQDFSYRYELVDGHGNFGSIDGDGAAAMRYTEARMAKITTEILRDLNKNTCNFVDNYDGSEKEPEVLPAKIPNLLVNGATGIAVGMATNIPPHNLTEVIDGILAYIENPEIEISELMNFVKGPDFPTGGMILGQSGIRRAYETGNGSIIVRSKTEIHENKSGKETIIVTEIPYQVNKAKLIEKIAELAKEKRVDGITEIRDESNRKGMRIVMEVRRDANASVILNNLFKYTPLQTSYGINMIALVDGQPKIITLKDAISNYVAHQIEVLTRRTIFDLEKAEARAHILEGLLKALSNVDEIVETIKSCPSQDEAREKLMSKFDLSEIQARSILDMRLGRLTGLERDKIVTEHTGLLADIANYNGILSSEARKREIVVAELTEIKDRFGDNRRTEINFSESYDIDDEDLIPREDVIITMSNRGYIKAMSLDEYSAQKRGGVGKIGAKTHNDDFVTDILMANTHDWLLMFTNFGRVYKLKGYRIPITSRTAKGLPVINLIPLENGEELEAIIPVKDLNEEGKFLFFCTKDGTVKRTALDEFLNIRQNGIRAINLREGDELLGVRVTDGTKDIILGASNGKAIRFSENDVRDMGRNASGVRGMMLEDHEFIIGMTVTGDDRNEILVVTENGYGKRSDVEEYRLQTRGGKGVKALNITEKNGNLVKLRSVKEDEDLMIITNKGIVIRTHIDAIAQTSRNTQGVRLIKLTGGNVVQNIAIVPREDDAEITAPDNEVEIDPNFVENDEE